MSIISARTIPYRHELKRPIETSHGIYSERAGYLLVVEDEEGRIGVGDAAPLPGLSIETLEECGHALNELTKSRGSIALIDQNALRDFPTSAQEYFAENQYVQHHSRPLIQLIEEYQSAILDLLPESPATLFALATALGELKAKRRNMPLSRAMRGDAVPQVPVNGMITETDPDSITKQVIELETRGFQSFKIKVGLRSPADDIARIRAASDACKDAMLRPDANAGWSGEWASEVLSAISRERIEFVEQPFSRGHHAEARALARKCGVRLALDEEIQTIAEAEELIRACACDVLVLKPMVIGRLYQCVLLAQKAHDAGIEVIYTSSWESDIGLAATLHLAAALGPNPPAMGLSTAGMISEGIVTNPLKIENGYLKVPEGPGLGMKLAPEILAQLK